MDYLISFSKGLLSLIVAMVALYFSFYIIDNWSSGIKGIIAEVVFFVLLVGLPFYIAEKLTFGKLGEAGTVILGLVILLAFGAYYKINSEKKLTQKYEKISAQLGLGYAQEVQLPQEVVQNPLINKGFMPRASHCLKGRYGTTDILVFNYHFEEVSGNEGDEYLRTPIVFSLSKVELPDFYLRPRPIAERIFKKRGLQFLDDPDFFKRYFLSGDDEQAVRELFTTRIRKLFKEMNRHWAVSASKGYMVMYADGKMDEEIKVDYEAMRVYLDQAYVLFKEFTNKK